MFFLYLLLMILGVALSFLGLCLAADNPQLSRGAIRRNYIRGMILQAFGFIMFFLSFGACCHGCANDGGHGVSKELNEITGQPRDPFPFNH